IQVQTANAAQGKSASNQNGARKLIVSHRIAAPDFLLYPPLPHSPPCSAHHPSSNLAVPHASTHLPHPRTRLLRQFHSRRRAAARPPTSLRSPSCPAAPATPPPPPQRGRATSNGPATAPRSRPSPPTLVPSPPPQHRPPSSSSPASPTAPPTASTSPPTNGLS